MIRIALDITPQCGHTKHHKDCPMCRKAHEAVLTLFNLTDTLTQRGIVKVEIASYFDPTVIHSKKGAKNG